MRQLIGRPLIVLGALAAVALISCNNNNGTAPGSGGNLMPSLSSSGGVARPGVIQPQKLNPIGTYEGAVNGEPNMFSPPRGDYPDGGHGQRVDGIGCFKTMILNEYHIHFFLGIIYHEKLIALPSAIGMLDPGNPVNGWTNSAKCFYRIHTHDSSDIVHLEFRSTLPYSAAVVPVGKVLDVWGVDRSSNQFGPFKGPIHIFYGLPPKLGEVTVDHFKATHKSLDSILIHSHEVVWVEIGPKYYSASQLPSVTFYMEY
jgi:hypothetical protein